MSCLVVFCVALSLCVLRGFRRPLACFCSPHLWCWFQLVWSGAGCWVLSPLLLPSLSSPGSWLPRGGRGWGLASFVVAFCLGPGRLLKDALLPTTNLGHGCALVVAPILSRSVLAGTGCHVSTVLTPPILGEVSLRPFLHRGESQTWAVQCSTTTTQC